jgi:hypothetical protein
MNRPKIKGTTWETAIVDYLRGRGARYAERRAIQGKNDRGDIVGVPGVVIEAKNAARVELGNWINELRAEVVNDGAALGAVWIKRRGKASPADGYAVITGEDLVTLLIEAGYIPWSDGKLDSVRKATP